MISALLFLHFISITPDSCAHPPLLPAYAHNDYRNSHPLADALELGYRGVEADIYRVGTELVVGHDRGELRSSRTLVSLYLEPLARRQRVCGDIIADDAPFLLTIELKQQDPEAFRILAKQLKTYEALFVPTSGASNSSVQVVLVGWWPSGVADSSWPQFLRVQLSIGEPALDARVGLVSIDYGKVVKWSGREPAPASATDLFVEARKLATTYGVSIRVHHAPERAEIYRWLLSQGVALIGVEHLDKNAHLLSPAVR